MITFKIFNQLDELMFSKDYEDISQVYSKSDPVMNVNFSKYIDLFNLLDYGISILKPYKNGKFVIDVLDCNIMSICNISSQDEVKGCLISDCFPLDGFDLIKLMYENHELEESYSLGVYDNEDNLLMYSQYKLVKYNDVFLLLSKDMSDVKHCHNFMYNLLDTVNYGFGLCSSDLKFHYSNPVLKNFLGIDEDDDEELFDYNFYSPNISQFTTSKEEINSMSDAVESILSGKYYFIEGSFKFVNKDKKFFYLEFNVIKYLLKENTVQIIFRDVTKINIEDRLKLSSEFDFNTVLEVSKSAVAYSYLNNKGERYYYRTKQFYDIIEREFRNDDIFYNVFNDYILGDNKFLGYDALVNSTINIPKENIYKIQTAKGNIKYIKIIININYEKKMVMSVLNDVTELLIYKNKLDDEIEHSVQLSKNLEIFSNLSKIGHTFTLDNNIEDTFYNDGFYNLIEKEPEDDDNKKSLIDELVLDKDKYILEENYSLINPDNPSVHFVVRLKTHKNNLKWVEYFVHCNYDEDGELKKTMGFFKDITQEMEFNNKLIEKSEEYSELSKNLDIIQKLTKTTIVIWDINKKTALFTDSFRDIYDLDENEEFTYDVIFDSILEEYRHDVEFLISMLSPTNLSFNKTFPIKTKKGNIKQIIMSSFYTTSSEGNPSIISYLQDVTEKVSAEQSYLKKSKQALLLKDNLNLIQSVSKTAIVIKEKDKFTGTDNVNNFLKSINKEFDENESVFEYLILDEDKAIYEDAISKINEEFPTSTFVVRLEINNEIYYVKGFVKAVYQLGLLLKTIYLFQDVTKEMIYKKQLEELVKDKNILIKERELLLKEVHHRVKNNLQVILSLISIEKHFNTITPVEIVESIEDSISSMALVHEGIYMSEDFNSIDLKWFFKRNFDTILNSHGEYNVKFILNMEDNLYLNVEILNSLALLIGELFTNSLYYAFPDKDGDNIISLTYYETNENEGVFIFEDNGIGLSEDINIHSANSLGFTLINVIADQIGAKLEVTDPSSSRFKITFDLDQKVVNTYFKD